MMTLDYARDDDRHLVTVTIRGAFDPNSWLAGVERNYREQLWTYGILYDLRQMTGDLTITDVKGFLSESLKVPGTITRGPIAIVVTDPTNYAKACTFAALARQMLTVDVFQHLPDAESWLVSHIRRP